MNAPQNEIELAIENALTVERTRVGRILDSKLCFDYRAGKMCEHPACYEIATLKLQVVMSE